MTARTIKCERRHTGAIIAALLQREPSSDAKYICIYVNEPDNRIFCAPRSRVDVQTRVINLYKLYIVRIDSALLQYTAMWDYMHSRKLHTSRNYFRFPAKQGLRRVYDVLVFCSCIYNTIYCTPCSVKNR